MKHAKKWLSLILVFIMTTGTPLSALAAWEDGFVIPGQSGGSSGYDDLLWEYTDDGLSIDSSPNYNEGYKKAYTMLYNKNPQDYNTNREYVKYTIPNTKINIGF